MLNVKLHGVAWLWPKQGTVYYISPKTPLSTQTAANLGNVQLYSLESCYNGHCKWHCWLDIHASGDADNSWLKILLFNLKISSKTS